MFIFNWIYKLQIPHYNTNSFNLFYKKMISTLLQVCVEAWIVSELVWLTATGVQY